MGLRYDQNMPWVRLPWIQDGDDKGILIDDPLVLGSLYDSTEGTVYLGHLEILSLLPCYMDETLPDTEKLRK